MQTKNPKEHDCDTAEDAYSKDEKRSYYYDDAHGYEKYDPEKDQDTEEDEETES